MFPAALFCVGEWEFHCCGWCNSLWHFENVLLHQQLLSWYFNTSSSRWDRNVRTRLHAYSQHTWGLVWLRAKNNYFNKLEMGVQLSTYVSPWENLSGKKTLKNPTTKRGQFWQICELNLNNLASLCMCCHKKYHLKVCGRNIKKQQSYIANVKFSWQTDWRTNRHSQINPYKLPVLRATQKTIMEPNSEYKFVLIHILT